VPTNRRNFLKASAVAAGALGLESLPGLASAASAEPLPGAGRRVERAKASLSILILGGTGFTGPEQVEYASQNKVTRSVETRRAGFFKGRVEQLTGDRTTT
jgi:2'-hydroxyisoflavone reductase